MSFCLLLLTNKQISQLKCSQCARLLILPILALHRFCFSVSRCQASRLRLIRTEIPDYALRGSSAELACEYNLGDSTLYSVRWFKDDDEFYRYVPMSKPPYQVFHKEGFVVDVSSTRNPPHKVESQSKRSMHIHI